MTSEVERRPAPVAPAITGPSLLSRVYGFGSIYGKTMRDSRRAVLVNLGKAGAISIWRRVVQVGHRLSRHGDNVVRRPPNVVVGLGFQGVDADANQRTTAVSHLNEPHVLAVR